MGGQSNANRCRMKIVLFSPSTDYHESDYSPAITVILVTLQQMASLRILPVFCFLITHIPLWVTANQTEAHQGTVVYTALLHCHTGPLDPRSNSQGGQIPSLMSLLQDTSPSIGACGASN